MGKRSNKCTATSEAQTFDEQQVASLTCAPCSLLDCLQLLTLNEGNARATSRCDSHNACA
eukprot:4872895-Amphidinium_carterae.1